MGDYLAKRETVIANAQSYFQRADQGDYTPIYRFGEGMIADEDIAINRQTLTIKCLANAIELPQTSHYVDMTESTP